MSRSISTLSTLAGAIPIVNIIDVLCDEKSGQVSLKLRDDLWIPYVRGTARTGFNTKWIKEHYETGEEAKNRAEYFVIQIKKYYRSHNSSMYTTPATKPNTVHSQSVPTYLNK